MDGFRNSEGGMIVLNMIATIKKNAPYLSEIDGAIGDGDHGINMKKGFSLCETEFAGKKISFHEGLKILGRTLLMEIGGSMGPLYGTFFREMAGEIKEKEVIDTKVFLEMLKTSLNAVEVLGKAKAGDKTLIDTLLPAVQAFEKGLAEGKSFRLCLEKMVLAAERGKDSTKNMVAKIGRSARLGERSRGTLDAGAVSCYLILDSMAKSVLTLL